MVRFGVVGVLIFFDVYLFRLNNIYFYILKIFGDVVFEKIVVINWGDLCIFEILFIDGLY